MSSQTQQGIFYNIFGLFEIKIKPLDMNSNIMCNKKQGIQHARISELLLLMDVTPFLMDMIPFWKCYQTDKYKVPHWKTLNTEHITVPSIMHSFLVWTEKISTYRKWGQMEAWMAT